MLTPGLLLKLERCQSWFFKHIFREPSFDPGLLLPKMSGLNSSASEIAIKSCSFLGVLSPSPIWLQLSEICSKVELRAHVEC